MLYPEHRVGRGNLMLRYSISRYPEFRRYCVISGGTQRRALPRHQSEKNYILNKYFIFSSGDRTYNQTALTVSLVPLRYDWILFIF